MAGIDIRRVSPGSTVQDAGRFGYLGAGIAASGPMDRGAFAETARLLGGQAGSAAIEFTLTGLTFAVEGTVRAAFAGGGFGLRVNGEAQSWPGVAELGDGAEVEVIPGREGVYGYVRFAAEIGVPPVLGSRATNLMAGLGGFEGRALAAGDRIALEAVPEPAPAPPAAPAAADGPIRILPGLHAEVLGKAVWSAFVAAPFRVTPRIDRMGLRLEDRDEVFADLEARSLVSDAVVPGDVQILGDGTPVILMRDHQPTGGYPRIATVVGADLDRLAQMRPGAELRFAPVSLTHAYAMLKART